MGGGGDRRPFGGKFLTTRYLITLSGEDPLKKPFNSAGSVDPENQPNNQCTRTKESRGRGEKSGSESVFSKRWPAG